LNLLRFRKLPLAFELGIDLNIRLFVVFLFSRC